jgi:hypothetical protein
VDEIIEKVIRKQYGDYEKDYFIKCGSVYLVKTTKKIVEEILKGVIECSNK